MDSSRFCAEGCGDRSGLPWCEHEWERIVYDEPDAAANDGEPWPDEDCYEDRDLRGEGANA